MRALPFYAPSSEPAWFTRHALSALPADAKWKGHTVTTLLLQLLETLLLRVSPRDPSETPELLHGVIALAVTLHTVILFPLSVLLGAVRQPPTQSSHLQLNLPVLSSCVLQPFLALGQLDTQILEDLGTLLPCGLTIVIKLFLSPAK